VTRLIHTDGVVGLRAWAADDAEWYATAARDPLIQQFTTESSTVAPEQVRDAIAALPGQPTAVGFLICDARTGARLGNLALDHEDGIGDVSYWLAADARGRGAATRAVTLLVGWAFDVLGLTELRLWCHADNIGSRRVAEHAGFVRDPARDRDREIKGANWPTVAYRLPAPEEPSNRAQISSTSAP